MSGNGWELDRLLRNEKNDRVFVLGAGFSKAVHERFPVTDALGKLTVVAGDIGMLKPHLWGTHAVSLDRLEAAAGASDRTFPLSFEGWLSLLAEPQPFLSHAENLANKARFAELSRAIWEVLSLIETDAVRCGLPAWLYRFVACLHAQQATVITFNYDRLIEIALHDAELQDFESQQNDERVIWSDPLDGVPARPPIAGLFGRDPVSTFRLCKLHGSLNWYWVPDDASGLSLNRWWRLDDDRSRSRHLPGREPFLVPPASAKSAFFANPVMSEIWRRAYVALEEAQSAVFVGYSLPLTDLTASAMFSRTLYGSPHASGVVNPEPGGVRDRVRQLTGQDVVSHQSVEQFVQGLVDDMSRHLGTRCRIATVPDDTRLLVGWNRKMLAKVSRVVHENGRVVVDVAEFDGNATLTVQGPDGPDESAVARPFRELKAALAPDKRIVARFRNGRESPIVGIDGFESGLGAAKFWQVLMPADRAADLDLQFEERIGVPR